MKGSPAIFTKPASRIRPQHQVFSALRFCAVPWRPKLNSPSLRTGTTWNRSRPLLATIFRRRACTRKMRFISLSLTFRCSTMKSSNISFRQSSGGKRVHLLCNQSFKFVPGLTAVHRTAFSPLRSKKGRRLILAFSVYWKL